jgi:predicted component of type VI protein secretion system
MVARVASEDWRTRAATHTREQFAAAYPHPFMLALTNLPPAPVASPTLRLFEDTNMIDTLRAERRRRMTPTDRAPAVFPVRKAQPTFPSMITVGRARNNDILLFDPIISKFHAYFSLVDGQWMLADAGSSNGTRINGLTLAPKGPAAPLRSGDELGFGHHSFRFLDAPGLWIALHDPR